MKTHMRAKLFAMGAHHGMVDKAGKPYYRHLVRVAAKCRTETAKTVAYLHDILEDTDVTVGDLRKMGFHHWVIDAVRLLTRTEGTPYSEYIAKIKTSKGRAGAFAKTVKIADLTDHLRTTSEYELPESLRKRYVAALSVLTS